MTYRYGPAPRIDTLRRDIAAAHDMLTRASAELDTLHDLAYTRPTATSTERTSGGTPDWALDTNGDHTARAALQTLAVRNTRAWITRCRTNLHTDNGGEWWARLEDLCARHPTAPISMLAAAAEGHDTPHLHHHRKNPA